MKAVEELKAKLALEKKELLADPKDDLKEAGTAGGTEGVKAFKKSMTEYDKQRQSAEKELD